MSSVYLAAFKIILVLQLALFSSIETDLYTCDKVLLLRNLGIFKPMKLYMYPADLNSSFIAFNDRIRTRHCFFRFIVSASYLSYANLASLFLSVI